jgi:pimeloyl-ACP methyl ester carboxylesterase
VALGLHGRRLTWAKVSAHGRAVADGIPGARFEILAEEAHQPFQEVPGLFNARLGAFWREVEAQG